MQELEQADEEMMRLAGLADVARPEAVAVRFFVEAQQDDVASTKAGHPVFKDVEVCEIRIPGTTDIVHEPVTNTHKERFPKHYLAFRRQQSQEAASGMPVSAWPQLTKAQVEELKYLGCHSVEQLAETSDGALQRFGPGWVSIRQKARDYLIAQKDGAILSRLRSELEERDAKIKTLEDMLTRQAAALAQAGITGGAVPAAAPVVVPDIAALVAEQVARAMAAVPPPAPKKRGRPPKAKTEPEVQ